MTDANRFLTRDAENGNGTGNGSNGSDRRVLIASADLGMRLYMRVVLKRSGYEVVDVDDFSAALAALHDTNLLIIDMTTHWLEGMDLCRRVRTRPEMRNHPVLGIVNRGEPHLNERGLTAGMDSCLSKPFLAQDLVMDVRRLIGK